MSLPLLPDPGDDGGYRPGLPLGFKGPQLLKTISSHYQSESASIVNQLYSSPLYSFRHTVSRFFKNFQSATKIDIPGLYLRFQLNMSQRIKLNSTSEFKLRENQFTGCFTESGNIDCHFTSKKEYETFDIFYSSQLLSEFTYSFPQIRDILHKGETINVPGKPCWTPAVIYEIIQLILNPTLDSNSIQLYYDLKLREILAHSLHLKYYRPAGKVQLTVNEIYQVHRAKEFLSEFICKKTPDIHFISKRIGLSIGKLRDGFRQEFHMSMFDWLLEEKMKHSHHLVRFTDEPHKLISAKVGYSRTSAFIRAYRKRYGLPPSASRRESKKGLS